MSEKTYKIRKSFLIPLSIDALLLFVLILTSLFTESKPIERIVLFVIFIPLCYFLLEVIFREVTISTEGLNIRKLLKKRYLKWNAITNVDTVILRKKVYLALTTTKGFQIISNSYGDFTGLVSDIIEHVDSEIVEGGVKDIVNNPIRKTSDIVGVWVAAFLLAAILYIKVFIA